MLNKKIFFFVFTLCVLIVACKPSNENGQLMSEIVSNKDTIEASNDFDCVFDTSSYKFTTEALLKFDKNLKYKWDNEIRQAQTILNNGDTLRLSIGGCNHFGYTAILVTQTPFNLTDSLLNQTRWLARTFFENGFEDYDKLIANKKISKSEDSTPEYVRYDVILADSIPENHIFEGFSFEKQNNNTIIEVGGYIN